MSQTPKPLYDLLLALFRSNDDLLILLGNYDYAQMDNLINALPGPNVPRTRFTMDVVQQLKAHGLNKPLLFKVLAQLFPGRSDLIEATKNDYFHENAAVADRIDEPEAVAPLGAAPTAELANTFEKIMGDRPTFLDVAYLAIGYQRAKAVAKLRMKFGETWFAGTAFLVTPNALFTAHHNLWTDGKPADAVEVIFDYERSTTGPDMESTMHSPDPESFAGDPKEDWAVMKLLKPQTGRPLAPLSKVPAKQGDRVAIIQHPGGMLKQVALHHNLVTYADESWVQYFTDTLPGSSGSPVFDAQWNVVAVHHKGGNIELPGKKQSVFRNQGIAINRIVTGLSGLGVKL